MTAAPTVTVAIVTYNSDATIGRCLAALGSQTFRDFEVIIVENGGTTAVHECLATTGVITRLIVGQGNVGFAAGNNLAAKAASSGSLWFAALNPDAYADPDWLERLMEATLRYPKTAMFGSTQRQAHDPTKADGLGDCYHAFGFAWRGGHRHALPADLADCEVFSPCAAAALYRLDAFRAVGGFDESYFSHMEDVDLGFRLRLAGHRCIQLADARVDHLGGASSPSAHAVNFGMRNTVWTYARNMPQPLRALLLPFHFAALALLLLHHRRKGNGPAAWSGLKAAWADRRQVAKERRQIQSTRVASRLAIMRALSWSWTAPLKMSAGGRRVSPESGR